LIRSRLVGGTAKAASKAASCIDGTPDGTVEKSRRNYLLSSGACGLYVIPPLGTIEINNLAGIPAV
jgi:hypothetical protein